MYSISCLIFFSVYEYVKFVANIDQGEKDLIGICQKVLSLNGFWCKSPRESRKIPKCLDLAASSCRNISIPYLKEAMVKWKNEANYNQFTVAYVSHFFPVPIKKKTHEILRNQWYDGPLLTWEVVETTRLRSQTLVPLPAPPTFVLRQIHPPDEAINKTYLGTT